MEMFKDEFRREIEEMNSPKVDMRAVMRGHQRFIRHKKRNKTISLCLIAAICLLGSAVGVPAGVWTVNHLVSNSTGWAVKGDGGYEVRSEKKSTKLKNGGIVEQYTPDVSDSDKTYSNISEASHATGLDLPDIFNGDDLDCEKVRVEIDTEMDSYSLSAVYAKGSKKVHVSIDSGDGITGDTILPYKVIEKKWVNTVDGSRILMQSGSGKTEMAAGAYLKDYILNFEFDNCTKDEAEKILKEADFSGMK